MSFRNLPAVVVLAAAAFTWGCTPAQSPAVAPPEQKPSDQLGVKRPGEKSDPSVVQGAPTNPGDNRAPLVAFGDSLTAGFGADPGQSYPDYLQKLIDHEGRQYRVYNMGVSGDTSTDGLERLPGVLAVHPKIVILELGGNDGLRGIPPAQTKQNLAKIIEALQGQGAKVVLAGMTLPRNYGPDFINQFEQMYVQLGNQYHVTRIPFLLDGVAMHKNLMQADGIHPTGPGNKIVADTVFKYVNPMLGKTA